MSSNTSAAPRAAIAFIGLVTRSVSFCASSILCDYFTLPEFRRSIYQVLERGEAVHARSRQICTQALPAKRGRRPEGAHRHFRTLTLVTNCVMAWNTERLQRAVDREAQRTRPRYSIDALRSIGPVGHRHINLRGVYGFCA